MSSLPTIAEALFLAGFAIAALLLFRFALPIIHKALLGVFRAQQSALGEGTEPAEEYAKLPDYDRPTHEQPLNMFGCHQQDGHLCAGWVGTHDMAESLSLRIAESCGHISPEEVDRLSQGAGRSERPVPSG